MARLWLALLLLVALPASAKPHRLTLLISVDSMSSELFQRMKPKFKGGFAQLLAQGAYFPYARYDYAENRTAQGHATIATGANPWRHGIVGNLAFNRATGKFQPTFVDATHPVLEAPLSADDTSPANLMAETIADRIRLATQGKGKAIAIAGKARSAIALGGKLGQAWWFSEPVGKFVTGTYYAKEFPDWVKAFNDKKPDEAWFGKEWTLSLKPAEYAGEDDRPFEADEYGLGRTFPHPVNGRLPAPGPQFHSAVASTPFLNDLTVAFAKEALVAEQLGRDESPDLLAVGFSATDRIYHSYGPYSWEAQDAMLKLDRALSDLLAAAAKAAGGRENVLVAVTADHGGAAVPEEWSAAGLTAGRLNPDTLHVELNRELKAKLGIEPVLGLEETDVYLDAKAIEGKKLDPAMVRRTVAALIAQRPQVAFAVARDDLSGADVNGYLPALRRGYYPDRSGDVLFVVRPYQVVTDSPNGTSHGTPYAYDAQVPLLLSGKGVRSGVFREEVRTVDIAPTLCSLLEIGTPAMAEGSARVEALEAK